jgi:hypothetical protein
MLEVRSNRLEESRSEASHADAGRRRESFCYFRFFVSDDVFECRVVLLPVSFVGEKKQRERKWLTDGVSVVEDKNR